MIFACGTRDVGNGRSVWAFTNAGALSWSYDTGGKTYGIVTDGANNVYVVGAAADNGDGNGTRNVWKLNNAGGYLTGSYILSDANAWAIDIDDDYIYISTGAGAVRTNHTFGSSSTIVSSSSALQSIKVDSNGNVYIGGGGLAATLRKYNSSLVLQWSEDTNDSCFAIDILSNGNVVIGTSDGEVRYYQSDGSSPNAGDWAVIVDGGASISIKVAVDSNDNIYGVRYNSAGSSKKRFIHLNTSGAEQGSITTASGDIEAIMVTSDDAVYVGGDVVNSYNIWNVNTTAYTLTNIANTTTTPVTGLSGDGISGSFSPADKTYSKKLIAIGNNQVWYESSAGTMSILSAANDDIDTTIPLTAFELLEKIFIVNGTNLKVADFGNTKIATDDVGSHPPDFNTVLTGGSGAKMIVDYITSTTADAACTIYGKRITSTTFTSGDTITGTDDDNNAISFTCTAAVEVAPPHWYDWTVFGNDSSFGAMPNQANEGCNYNGRPNLTADKDYPHQWYQARQKNPWDWNYVSNDAQSPVAGNDADAGEVGDIIVVSIPYKDDYLIHACANTLWVLVGDAAEHGSIVELDLTNGILGPRAWCWDNRNNLYILGTTGILKIPERFGAPENLTSESWPDFIDDLAYNSATHRLVMGYDRKRDGLKISKTTLADGANSCWWYDFRTEGLFPESYPEECGMFSMFYYESVDPTYSGLLDGCFDGYIRTSNDAAVDDDIGDSDEAIDSYYTVGPVRMGQETKEGIFTSLLGVPAGGRTVGSLTKSSDIAWRLWTAETADELVEKLLANTTPKIAGTMTALGTIRGARKRREVRGMYAGIRLGNSTVAETWSLERLQMNFRQGGRLK